MWKVLPGKEKDFKKLFSKNLSDHGPSAHKELSKGIGMIFEAVFAENYAENVPDAITSVRDRDNVCTIATNDKQLRPEISFTSKIRQLEEENANLLQRLHECQENVVAESEHRRALEQEVNQLYGTQQTLQEQVQHYAVTADFFKSNVSKYFQGLDKVLPMLEELRSGLSLGIPK
jgi:hypothetical protein